MAYACDTIAILGPWTLTPYIDSPAPLAWPADYGVPYTLQQYDAPMFKPGEDTMTIKLGDKQLAVLSGVWTLDESASVVDWLRGGGVKRPDLRAGQRVNILKAD